MKNFKRTFKLQIISAMFLLLTASFAQAAADPDTAVIRAAKSLSLVTKDLSQKLKTDLAEENLNIKVKKVEESQISNTVIEVKGEAFCVLPNDKTELPIVFEAKFDSAKNMVSDITYTFVDSASSAYAPSTEEEILMKELMKKISLDYKTDQITIAIDGFEALPMQNNETGFKGIGEVKIGELVWNKISFDVVMTNDKSASKIKYELKK